MTFGSGNQHACAGLSYDSFEDDIVSGSCTYVQTPLLGRALDFRTRTITRPASHPSEKQRNTPTPISRSTHLPIPLASKLSIVPPESSVKTDPPARFEQGCCVPEDAGRGHGEGGAVKEVV